MSKLFRKLTIRVCVGALNLAMATAATAQAPDHLPDTLPPAAQPAAAPPQGRAGAHSQRPSEASVNSLSGATAPVQEAAEADRSGPREGSSQAIATIVVDGKLADEGRQRGRREGRQRGRRARRSRDDDTADDGDGSERFHGLRLGYVAMLDYDKPTDANDPDSSPKQRLDLQSPHSFLLGYELAQRIIGGGWLDILLIANGTVVGLEQSKFMPNANMLIGFEFRKSLQLGVGINLAPVKDKAAHMILAAGWTPSSGELMLPVHVFVIPDVDGNHRIGATVGVNWDL